MEAVELREEELAIAVVLGACGGLRACARVGGGVAASGWRRGLGWGLLGAVVLLQEVPMQALERAEGGGIPCGGVLEVVAWQPDLLSRACKGAQEGNKPGVGRVGGSVACNHVVGDTEAAFFVRLMEPHVNPVLLGPRLVCFPGPFLEEGVGDLPIDMLLL